MSVIVKLVPWKSRRDHYACYWHGTDSKSHSSEGNKNWTAKHIPTHWLTCAFWTQHWSSLCINNTVPQTRRVLATLHVSVFGTLAGEVDGLTRFSRGDCVINYGWGGVEYPGWDEDTCSPSRRITSNLFLNNSEYIYRALTQTNTVSPSARHKPYLETKRAASEERRLQVLHGRLSLRNSILQVGGRVFW